MLSKRSSNTLSLLPPELTFAETFPLLNAFIECPSQREPLPFLENPDRAALRLQCSSLSSKDSMATGFEDPSWKESLPIMGLNDFFEKHPEQPGTGGSQKRGRNGLSVPIPVGHPRTAESVVKLYQICNKHRIQPHYTFDEFKPQMFAATLNLPGLPEGKQCVFVSPQDHDVTGHPSKHAAKEAVSKLALEVMGNITHDVQISNASVKLEPPEDSSTNWMGKLNEFAQAKHVSLPKCQEYIVGSGFTCELSFGSSTFGDQTRAYATKKAARAAAARAAIEHLEAQGEDCSGRPTKRRKSTSTEGSRDGSMNQDRQAPNYKSLVNEICIRLLITQPTWHFEPHPAMPSYFSGGAFFLDPTVGAGANEMVGEVRNVLGKKKAKEESARAVYAFLVEVEQSRIKTSHA